MSIFSNELKPVGSKFQMSGETLTHPVEVPHSFVGDSDQQTHTMRNRFTNNSNNSPKFQGPTQVAMDFQANDAGKTFSAMSRLPPKNYLLYSFPYTQEFLLSGDFKAATLEPQFGSFVPGVADALSAFKVLAATRGINLPRKAAKIAEGLISLFFALRESTSKKQFVSILVLYLNGMCDDGVMFTLSDYIQTLFALDSQDSDSPQWIDDIKGLQTNWHRSINGEGFALISKTLSLCLSLGMCNVSNFDFTVAGLKMFSVPVSHKHHTAVDLIDAVFATVTYFLEGGYQCFTQGTLKPLLFGGFNMEGFENSHAKCLEWNEMVRAGNLERCANATENDFEKLLSETIETSRDLIRTAKGPVEKNILVRKMEVLLTIRANFRQTRVQGGLRVAPYALGLYGTTGVGKSSLTNLLMDVLLTSNGFDASPDRIVTVNESDKFMSNYRSYVNGVIIDDLGNTKAEFVEKAPTARIIEIVNNVKAYANVAEADIKGKVSIEPYVTIITTNVKGYCADKYSNEPASIARRANVTVTVRVRDEYATDNQLCPRKIRELHPDGVPRVPDFWLVDIQHAFPLKSEVAGKPDDIGWRPVMFEGRAMTNVSVFDLIRCCAADSNMHFVNQRSLVENANSLHENMEYCDKCLLPIEVCRCAPSTVSTCQEVAIVDDVPDLEVPVDEEVPGFIEDDNVSVMSEQAGIHPLFSIVRRPKMLADTLKNAAEGGPLPIGLNFWSAIMNKMCYRTNKWYEFWKPRREAYKPVAFMLEMENSVTSKLISDVGALEQEKWFHWTSFIPQWGLDNAYASYVLDSLMYNRLQDSIKLMRRRTIGSFLSKATCLLGSSLLFSSRYPAMYMPCMLLAGWGITTSAAQCLINLSTTREVAKSAIYSEIQRRREALPESMKLYRESHMKYILGASASLGAIYALVSLWRATKLIPEAQGNLAPTKMSEIKERDAEQNPWSETMVSPIPCTVASKTTAHADLERMVQNNLYYMSFDIDGRQVFCNAFFPCSNVALIPQHVWKKDELKVKFVRHDPKKIGGNFSALISKASSVPFSDSDLSLVWIPNGGDHRDLTEFFPTGKVEKCPASLSFRNVNGNIELFKMLMRPGSIVTHAGEFEGHNYVLNKPTFKGLCMAVAVTETKGPVIGGFHLGGVTGTTEGASGTVTRAQLDIYLSRLRMRDGVLLSKNSGTLPTSKYDVQYFQDNNIHPKSPINFLPPGANLKYYGQVAGRSTYYSSVVKTPISETVEQVCDVPNKWGKPKFNEGYPWQASLQYSSNPSAGVPGDVLATAVCDYKGGLIEKIDSIPGLKKTVRPLTDMETVCGIDGMRFVDKMAPNTSVGYPLSGPKRDHLTLLDPEEHPTHQCPAELDAKFHEEAKAMEDLYLKGERAYPFFKACLKDEPTPIDKDKVRVFQSAPIAFQLLIRKYYLPIMRLLSIFPLESECAVGINAQGPEWQAFSEHVKKFGEERILAGDFSKYDLRMPAQLMMASFRIFIDIAKHCGYDARTVAIMEGIASDISYPLMAYNGDLLQLFGSNPSGQNLTVYLNGVVNSLLLRCSFYSIFSSEIAFRSAVAAMTYGDDLKSSVNEKYPEFNHVTYANYLKGFDIVFTMPDKESQATEYMHDLDADFLKRKNVTIPELGICIGALSEDSIFKSLHSVLKSSAVTTTQQSMSNIDGALREWFAHGREVYEKRRVQMNEVANTTGISHGCLMLNVSYDDYLQSFVDKHNVERLDKVPESESL